MSDLENFLTIHRKHVASLEASIQDWAHKHANVCGELEDLQACLFRAEAVCKAAGKCLDTIEGSDASDAATNVLAARYTAYLAGEKETDNGEET